MLSSLLGKKRKSSPLKANQSMALAGQGGTSEPPVPYHVYGSNTSNSLRTQAAADVMSHAVENGTKMGSRANRKTHRQGSTSRAESRDSRIHNLPTAPRGDAVKSSIPTFFHGNPQSTAPEIIYVPEEQKYQVLPVGQTLKIMDSKHGGHLKGVFIMLPRNKVSEFATQKTFQTFHKILMSPAAKSATTRGKSTKKEGQYRQPEFESKEEAKYISFGAMPIQGERYILDNMKDITNDSSDYAEVSRFFSAAENHAKQYLPSGYVQGLQEIQKKIGYVGFPLNSLKRSTIWTTVACGYNVFLPMHYDEDFFWSLTTVLANRNFVLDDKIMNYFCFPHYGVAVALRPGDVLIFNPLVHHCVSTRETTEDVVCLSLYLKTKNIAGNDVQQQLSGEQWTILEKLLTPKQLVAAKKKFTRQNPRKSIIKEKDQEETNGVDTQHQHPHGWHRRRHNPKKLKGQDNKPLAMVLCSACKKKLPWMDYSRTQLKKGHGKQKCTNCVSGTGLPVVLIDQQEAELTHL